MYYFFVFNSLVLNLPTGTNIKTYMKTCTDILRNESKIVRMNCRIPVNTTRIYIQYAPPFKPAKRLRNVVRNILYAAKKLLDP